VLLLELHGGADDTGGGVGDEHVEGAGFGDERLGLLGVAHVAAQEQGLGAALADLLRGLLGRRVGAQVADRDPGRAEVGEAERDLASDPARAARDEGRLALEDRH
jgi:hypothetical protein